MRWDKPIQNKEESILKTFRRTLATTTIQVAEITVDDGQVTTKQLDPILVFGERLTEDQAEKVARKAHLKGAKIIVTGLVVTEETYGCDLDEFMKIATKVEKKEAK